MRWLPLALAAVLAAQLINAAITGDGGRAVAWLTSDPWGIATLLDLYLGIVVFGLLVWHIEQSVARALAWFLPSLLLGNLLPAVYICVRLTKRAREASTPVTTPGSTNVN